MQEENNQRFKADVIVSQKDGSIVPLIYAQEYPWVIAQVVPTTPDNRQRLIDHARMMNSLPYFANGDNSFFVIQAKGTTDNHHVEITQDNYTDVYQAVKNCLQDAADWYHLQQQKN